MAEKKYFLVSEEQMDLICSIINNTIEKSEGCKNGEWDVDNNGMYYTPESFKWGFVTGDDMDDAQANESEVVDSLNWVLKDCMD